MDAVAKRGSEAGDSFIRLQSLNFLNQLSRQNVIGIEGKNPVTGCVIQPEIALSGKRVEPTLYNGYIRVTPRNFAGRVVAKAVQYEHIGKPG
jgi:hypothetical protein